MIIKKAPISECPNCGSTFGYYTIDDLRNFDGSKRNNSSMSGKYAYCVHCDKKLFKMSEVEISKNNR
jgi:DNA-directed RNA polymerase subunit RPC12/RpoP